MAYKVLYRKYRPKTFSEIIGQNTIVSTIKNSIIENKVSHAYIFTGPRGTGKTSTAKVLAKTLNCTNPINGEACNECQNCQSFNSSADIIEIDAASNNGVDEIRELRNNVTLTPTSSKYKIYIIDEVHMLTTGAFNALLKTLEEPPAHAVFILATTEVYKVPITILSRCQRFDFKKISKNEMIECLIRICNQEKINCDNQVLEEIYELSDGCMRDALSILDQTAKTNSTISVDTLLENYNIVSTNKIEKIIEYTFNGEVEKLLEALNELEDSGMNSQKLIQKMVKFLENLAINIKLNKNKSYPFDKIKSLIEKLNKIYIDARVNENTFVMIKLTFLEMVDKPNTIEEKNVQVLMQNTQIKETKPKLENIVDIRINNCFVEVNKEELAKLITLWQNVEKDAVKGLELASFKPVAASSKYAIFTIEEESLVELFNMKCEIIEKVLNNDDLNIKIIAVSETRWNIEKEKYKQNFKNKVIYTYIEEPKKETKNEALEVEVHNIFADMPVEIS